ncbi:GspE/PulE family protein [Hydrogenophaga sp.]|uniref:GspE/PulE family protein n=1 Tax=Hydrogenophaga sp. TaxID=1904254 RepID=UPI002ABD0238|nr:GspE/PulE family protein [Hydrogenophaga sp.]MDZ4398791.1 GspE/PulE family protein [Hydrogenophaga sp.]
MSPTVDWAAVRTARAAGQTTTDALAQMQPCTPREAARLLAHELGLACWETAQMAACEPAFDRLPLARAQSLRAVLLHSAAAGRVAVVHDPLDHDLCTQLRHWAQVPLTLVLASADDIHAYLNQQEAGSSAVDALERDMDAASRPRGAVEELSLARVSDATSPTVKLVNSTLYDALRAGASDVHLESTPNGLAVKYRIDGTLDAVTEVPGVALAEQAISRLKVLAELDIAERRVPQDGSFRVSLQGREVDLRVSIIPGVHGEDAVIRILDKRAMVEAHGQLRLDTLGFEAGAVGTLRELMEAAYGMLLVTGPTGSGKTTTLYAALSETHTGRDKIVTIEDPVEYQLPGVLQIPVNEKKGLTFARGLRSILRHDPDKIMVGEIRDRETAEIAVQSALTGHLVLTTVHANNVFDVFGRFTHMGLDPYSLVSALNGIWAQRLLRLNCPHCSRSVVPDARELARLGLPASEAHAFEWRAGAGCGDCRGTGYKGRRAVAEVLRLDDELREMIVAREPVRRVKEAAHRKGTRTLTDAALQVARAGGTTLEEVRRVTLAA